MRVRFRIVSVLAALAFAAAAWAGSIDPALQTLLASATGPVDAIVEYSDGPPTASDLQAIAALNVPVIGLERLPYSIITADSAQINQIAQFPDVATIWKNESFDLLDHTATERMGPGSPISSSFWLKQIRADLTQAAGFDGGSRGGKPVGVAVVDTGVDATHPSLGFDFPNGLRQAPFRVIQNAKIEAANPLLTWPVTTRQVIVENIPNTDDNVGHGTHVAGVIAGGGEGSKGVYKGVAPGARIIGVEASTSLALLTKDILLAFDYILLNRELYNIRVVNNSWGSTGPANPSGPIARATRALTDNGIVVVFSAGNSGPPSSATPFPVNQFAKLPWNISAGASSPTRGLTFFSSRDPKQDPNLPGVPPEEYVTVVAPGEDIVATRSSTGTTLTALGATNDLGQVLPEFLPTHTSLDGTSFSAPMTSGAVAVLLDAEPSLTPAEVKQRLRSSAAPLLGYAAYQVGGGLLDVAAAVGLKDVQPPPQRPGAHIHNQIGEGYSGGFIVVSPGIATTDVNFRVYQGADRFDLTLNIKSNMASSTDTSLQTYRIRLVNPADQQVRFIEADIALNTDATFTFSIGPDEIMRGTWDLEIRNFGPGLEPNSGRLLHSYEMIASVVYK